MVAVVLSCAALVAPSTGYARKARARSARTEVTLGTISAGSARATALLATFARGLTHALAGSPSLRLRVPPRAPVRRQHTPHQHTRRRRRRSGLRLDARLSVGRRRARQRGRVVLSCTVRLTLVAAASGALKAVYHGTSTLEVDRAELRTARARHALYQELIRGAARRAADELTVRLQRRYAAAANRCSRCGV